MAFDRVSEERVVQSVLVRMAQHAEGKDFTKFTEELTAKD